MVAPDRETPGRDLVDVLHPRLGMPALDGEDGEPAHHQHYRNHPGGKQHRLDVAVGHDADHHRRQEAQQDVDDEPLRLGVVHQAGRDMDEAVPVHPADGKDGAELDGDLEHPAGRALKAQQVDEQDQVAGRGDGDELGQTLDDAEQRCGEKRDGIHGRSSGLSGLRHTCGCRKAAIVGGPGRDSARAGGRMPCWRGSGKETVASGGRPCKFRRKVRCCPGARWSSPPADVRQASVVAVREGAPAVDRHQKKDKRTPGSATGDGREETGDHDVGCAR